MVPQWIFVLAWRFGPQSAQKMRRFQLFCYSRRHSSKFWKKLIRIDRNLNKIQIGIPFHVLQIKNQLNHLIVIESSWTLFCCQPVLETNLKTIWSHTLWTWFKFKFKYIRISTPTNKEVLTTKAHVYLLHISKPLLNSLPQHKKSWWKLKAFTHLHWKNSMRWLFSTTLRITGPSNGRVNEPV